MRAFLLPCTLWLCLAICLWPLHAQTQPASAPASSTATPAPAANPKTPEEFFARARQFSDLEASGIPFHLKATFVAAGDAEFTGNGTYEEWWASKDSWRIEATLGDYKHVAFQNRSYSTSDYVPLRLRQAMEAVLIHIPTDIETSHGWKIQHKNISGMDLTVLSQKHHCVNKNTDSKNDQCVREYFLSPEGLVRIRVVNSTETIYNGFQNFQSILVPHKIEVASGASPFLTITVNTIEPIGAEAKDLPNLVSIPQGLQPDENLIHSDSGATGARLIHQVAPSYPVEALEKRIQGTVVIRVTIDKKGNVREPHVVQSAGKLLDDAALSAVRNWQYQPTFFEGKAVNVNTTISVVFRLNH